MRINHIGIYCHDLEAMKSFFETYFSATSDEMYHNQRTGLRTYMLSLNEGSTRIEIMNRPGILPATPSMTTGYVHLSMSVGQRTTVDKLTDTLRTCGYTLLDGPRTTGDGYYESCIKGPEGILIEITE